MKLLASIFCVWICGLAWASAGTFLSGSPDPSDEIRVLWVVPKEVWPIEGIWSYKVLPQEFSDVVVSNAMAIGSFTTRDKVRLSGDARAIDKKAMFFKNKAETRWLEILPTLGYIKYYDESAQAKAVSAVKDVPEPVVGVPSLEEATKLGLRYIRLLGIDVSQIARKPGSREFDLHWEVKTREWVDQKSKRTVRETLGFAVDFTRSIDGIEVSGFGDIFVDFGNNAKVHELEVSWRNLQPSRLNHDFVTGDEVIKAIQNHQTALPVLESLPLRQIKTLTITNATPRYVRGRGDAAMDFVDPVLQLDAVLDDGRTNRAIWFQTGALSHKHN